MENPVFEYAKKHPAITAVAVGGIALVIYVVTRSGSGSSDLSSIASEQAQQAQLANQNAAVQAQAQVAENQAALQAQAQNNGNAAALASVVAQYNAQNTATGAAEQVALEQEAGQTQTQQQYISAAQEVQDTQTQAESGALNSELNYLTQVNNNQSKNAQAVLGVVAGDGNNGGIFYGQSATTNEALLSALALATPAGSASIPSAENALGITSSSGAYAGAYQNVGYANAASSLLTNLFG